MIGAKSDSMGTGARGSEPVAGNEPQAPVTQIPLEVGSVCGSDAAGTAASVAGLSFPSSDGVICSGSMAGATTGTISYVWTDDRFRSCSSWWQRAVVVVSNPSKIKSPQISAT